MISKRSQTYAQALFELEADSELAGQLKALADIFQSSEMMDFFLSFTVSEEDKKQILKSVFKSAAPLLKNLLFVLLDNRAFFLFPKIALAYGQLMDEREGLCRGTLYSPFPVSVEEKRDIEKHLQKFFNKRLALEQKEDKSLIGGLYIEAGGFVFNGTIKNQLKQFRMKGA